MHSPDLAPYQYHLPVPVPGVYAVGWYEAPAELPKGAVDPLVLVWLRVLCLTPVRVTRGYHVCHYCREKSPFLEDDAGRRFVLGSAEVWVRNSGGKIYAAPNLIYHYIESHGYLPPAEFLEGVAWSYEHRGTWDPRLACRRAIAAALPTGDATKG